RTAARKNESFPRTELLRWSLRPKKMSEPQLGESRFSLGSKQSARFRNLLVDRGGIAPEPLLLQCGGRVETRAREPDCVLAFGWWRAQRLAPRGHRSVQITGAAQRLSQLGVGLPAPFRRRLLRIGYRFKGADRLGQ